MPDFDIQMDDLPEEFREIASLIGLESALKLSETYGGESIYIYKPDTLARMARNRLIASEFNGVNYGDLARKYNLTASMIRQIVIESKPARTAFKTSQVQTSLF